MFSAFTGGMLRDVLDRLREQSQGREIKVVRLDRYQQKAGDVAAASKRRERGDKFN